VPSLAQLPPGCRFQDRCAFVLSACRGDEPALRGPTGRLAACVRVDERGLDLSLAAGDAP